MQASPQFPGKLQSTPEYVHSNKEEEEEEEEEEEVDVDSSESVIVINQVAGRKGCMQWITRDL